MPEEIREYEMWHDEYQCSENGFYIHGILLIPVDKRQDIANILERIRSQFGYGPEDKCGFAGSLGSNLKSQLLRNHLKAGSRFLHVKPAYNDTHFYQLDGKGKYDATQGEKPTPFISISEDDLFGVKIGMLIISDNHSGMYGRDHAEKIETTLRFGLKGLCHFCFDNTNPVVIKKIYFDGYEHYQRSLDLNKIVGTKDWREYIKIDVSDIIIDPRHRADRADETALFIDFVDVMVGGMYNKIYSVRDDSNNVLQPLGDIEDRLRNGTILKNKNSRWSKSITVSEMCLTLDPDNPFKFNSAEFPENPNQKSFDL
jgi:hypothetical protein